ncbi:MAG: glycosyltransferase [Gemmatimonadetes bacterium]|uniref:Glycosyltransferase n=1 Tax=Candidatus Kutchimonas denitrificans TaxID=3056748 RepID=A0AAE4ZAM1_9BACT|nr:glycosyltransferase [Gemmatimonadota bacterium]NIR75246.1 glycosyltransferase [Candidatus Kutchimonas denitrificans]NIS00184.1 glycosyltransferase [Gemmatimonadota bacterium]NIT65776.1 glycosyltransferase [Gemmatimonadota bacterium]NIU53054.1 glycosyltransferase [Gemmatimonadota bacterium]
MSRAIATHEEAPAKVEVDAELADNFSVVIPAFNESDNIPELFREIEATFREHGLDGEVILVDDGSSDDSSELARREGARFRRFKLERHKRNLGKTEALLTGARAATTDWLVLFDADLQHSPGEIPRLLAEAAKGYDIVCGRKVGKYEKRLVSGIYNWMSRKAFRVPARDLNSIKIFRTRVLDDVQLRHDWHRFFVVLAHAKGYKVGELDVTLHPRRRGETKYGGSSRVFVGLLDLVSVWFLLIFSRKPMLLFGFTGLLLVGLGLLVGITAIVLRLLGHGFRPLLTLVVLLGIMGVSLFGFGFVAELIATLRAEVDDLRESLRESRKDS